jgi:molybdopterin converting factor small subunit
MALNSVSMQVNVLAFGPIAEKMGGREHKFEVPPNSSVRFLLEEIGLDMWLGQGIVLSINGSIVGEDEPISEGDEVALLPPVSGG